MVTQLRIYTIAPGKMEEWVRGWKEGVYPLRRKHGFDVPGAWVVQGEDRFVWIVRYDGPEPWESKETAYYESAERKALDPDPARFITKTERHFLRPVVTS